MIISKEDVAQLIKHKHTQRAHNYGQTRNIHMHTVYFFPFRFWFFALFSQSVSL